ncbi:MAG TPA: acetamidase/formamidase family protein [Mycobacteriales bacterium]|nr:acetamidase/formamidase family protein [Mycobacteriales bacterium]
MQLVDDRHLHGFFDPALAPAVTVDSGETVRFRTLESGWSPEPFDITAVPDRPRHPAWTEDSGHALSGPVEVRGAKAGQVLEIRIESVLPGSWGTTYANTRRTAFNDAYGLEGQAVHRWTLDPVAGTGRNQHGHTVGLRPFLGVMGMPPAQPGRHSTVPPRTCGGNLDCRELVAGSTLWLPIPVDGALLSVGDGHAAQGDGEVSGTAIECPMEQVDLTLSTVDFPMSGPVARTPAGWVTMGLGDTLDVAGFRALNAMFDLVARLYGVPRADAVALASVAVDLRVTQIVNQVVGCHAVLAPGAIR